MKYIVIIVIGLLTLTSCYKQYSQPKTLSLSGEYIVDRITYSKIENSTTPDEQVYNGGDIYVNPNGTFPMDSISVGFTRWHLDYSVISFSPRTLNTGRVIWSKQYYYSVINHSTNYDLGYIDFTTDNGGRRVFKIIDDGIENLVLRTTGQWGSYGPSGPEESVTIYLTRVGP
jgi:hypothetical protein